MLNYTVTDSLGLSAVPVQLIVIVYESAQVQGSLQLISNIPYTGVAAKAQARTNIRQLTDASGSTANTAFRSGIQTQHAICLSPIIDAVPSLQGNSLLDTTQAISICATPCVGIIGRVLCKERMQCNVYAFKLGFVNTTKYTSCLTIAPSMHTLLSGLLIKSCLPVSCH